MLSLCTGFSEIHADNAAPVLAKIGKKTANVDQTLSFTATATDANTSQSKIYSLVNQPAGASINGSTGVFSWKPSTIGTYTFIVKVKDNGSPVRSDQEEITVTVTRSLTLSATADTYARNGIYNTTNYGNSTTLKIKGNGTTGYTRMAFVKFPLGSVSQVSSAILRIYGRNDQDNVNVNLSAFGINDSWTETGITWLNGPAGLTPVVGLVSVNSEAKYYEIDVTTYVKTQLTGSKVVSMALYDNSGQNKKLVFNSRENSSNQPQLVIETTTAVTAASALVADIEKKEGISAADATARMSPGMIDKETGVEKSVVYPNPVRQRFTVELSKLHKEKVSMQVVNLLGKTYSVKISNQLKTGSKAEVDISNLSLEAGIYLLRIQSASKSEVIKMMVVD